MCERPGLRYSAPGCQRSSLSFATPPSDSRVVSPHSLQGSEDGRSDEGEEGDGDGMDMDSDGLEEDGEGESDEDGLEGLGSDLEEEDGGRGRRSGKSVGKKSGRSVGKSEQGLHPVEDRFMRLSEMEAFLQEAEEKAAGGDEEEEEEGEEDEEDEGDEDGSGDEDCESEGKGRGSEAWHLMLWHVAYIFYTFSRTYRHCSVHCPPQALCGC